MRRCLLVAAAAAGLLLTAVPTTLAATSGGTIKTCENKRTGALRLLHGKRCRKGERLVTWNKQGVSGATGAKGDKGDKGDTGAAATKLLLAVDNRTTTPHIVFGPPGASVQRFSGGAYFVGFGRDITQCVPVATVGGVPVVPGGSTPAATGFARIDMVGASPGTFLGLQNGTYVEVTTYSISGGAATLTDTSFFLAMLC
jgi:hypothetical protein